MLYNNNKWQINHFAIYYVNLYVSSTDNKHLDEHIFLKYDYFICLMLRLKRRFLFSDAIKSKGNAISPILFETLTKKLVLLFSIQWEMVSPMVFAI